MRKQKPNTISIFIEDNGSSTNSAQEENKFSSKEIEESEEEASEAQEVEKRGEEGKETSGSEGETKKKFSNNKEKILILSQNHNKKKKETPNGTKNNRSKRKPSKINNIVSEEEEEEGLESNSSSEDDLSRKSNKIDSKINIQSNGSNYKGKGVVGPCKDDDSTYDEEEGSINSEENGEEGLGTTIRRSERLKNKTSSKHNLSWLDDDLLEESNEESEMEVDNLNSENDIPFYKYFKRAKKSEDELMDDTESQIPINGRNNNNSNSNNETNNNHNLKLPHDQFFHPYRLDNRIRMIEQTLQRTTWKEHLSETRINRLEAKNYKLKQEYRQLKKQLKKQRQKENNDTHNEYSSSSCNINPDQLIQNLTGESSSRGIDFDYKVVVAGLVGFGLGGLASHYL